ncbi:MAG: helix-turn-helix domain-containing protein, partial [Patescibacteria group bacterium]
MQKKSIPDKLMKALLQLNLTEKEIYTYVVLLEMNKATVQEISIESGINRVSVYSAIEILKKRGLISEGRKGKRRVYVAESPNFLLSFVEEKKQAVKKEEDLLQSFVLPMLNAINVKQENKPQIKFFEKAEGINRVFDEYVLRSPDVINCGSYETAGRIISLKQEKEYFERI